MSPRARCSPSSTRARASRARCSSSCSPPTAATCCSRPTRPRSEEHTSELQSPCNLVCRLLLEKKNAVDRAGVFKEAIEGLRIARQAGLKLFAHTARSEQTHMREPRQLFGLGEQLIVGRHALPR